MERLTLREAAERTSRSVTTLRRYIRSGRLHAEKRYGRFGPEYFVSTGDLVASGLEPDDPSGSSVVAPSRPEAPERALAPRATAHVDAVPMVLYQELQMKHEQLLVQYGMLRAGGLRPIEQSAEIALQQRRIREQAEQIRQLENRAGDGDTASVRRELHEARLELEARGLEIAALQEKVRALEMLTRNAVTSESIEKQYRDVLERSVRTADARDDRGWPQTRNAGPEDEPDH